MARKLSYEAMVRQIESTAKTFGQAAPELVRFILNDCATALVVAATDNPRSPPISVLSTTLPTAFDRRWLTNPRIRQLIGKCVKAVLIRHGFESVPEVRIMMRGDALFSTGAIFRLADSDDDKKNAVYQSFYRIVQGLNPNEIALLRKAINAVEQDNAG